MTHNSTMSLCLISDWDIWADYISNFSRKYTKTEWSTAEYVFDLYWNGTCKFYVSWRESSWTQNGFLTRFVLLFRRILLQLAAGLCCGLSGLAAGGCIGIVGEYGVRCVGYRASNITLFPGKIESAGYATIPDQTHGGDNEDLSGSDDQNKLFVGMLIMLIFSEALAL